MSLGTSLSPTQAERLARSRQTTCIELGVWLSSFSSVIRLAYRRRAAVRLRLVFSTL